jgi:hypothetical protein
MIETRVQQPVSLDLFRPVNQEREISPALTDLLLTFYGTKSRIYCEGVREGRFSDITLMRLEDEIDAHFFETIDQTFRLREQDINPRSFYNRQQQHAKQVVGQVIDQSLPDAQLSVGLKNEVSLYPEEPHELLVLLSAPESEIDPVLRFEVQRHLLLSHIAGSINSRSRNANLQSELFHIQKYLNKTLYSGRVGTGTHHEVYAEHDSLTNTALDIKDAPFDPNPGSHMKRHEFLTRFVEGVGPVLTMPRKKDDASAVLKAMRKAALNGGVVRPLDDVQDNLGIMFVTLGNRDDTPERLQELVRERLARFPRSGIRFEQDNDVNGYQSQQLSSGDFLRLQVSYDDMPIPVELMFYKLGNYIDTQYQIGEKDEQNGVFNGRAHSLYRPTRILPILPYLFPESVYGVDVRSYALARMEHVAEDLREKNRIPN